MQAKGNLSDLQIEISSEGKQITLCFPPDREIEIGSYSQKQTAETLVADIWKKIREEVSDFSKFEKIVFDLSQVSYLAGVGCGILFGLHTQAKTLNLEFSVLGTQPNVAAIIRLCKLDTVFQT